MVHQIFMLLVAGCLISLPGCQQPTTLFRPVASSESGITFANTIVENDSLNVIDYTYIYNGGGVGVGDVNNDGYDDIFFAGNQVSSQLYLNQGDFTFQDATEAAGVGTDRWATGVAMVDINQDSWLDIYVCVASKFDSAQSKNYFFINQGADTPGGAVTFVDQAEEFGLADAGYSTQSAFFDYDHDGDLDMYLLTNRLDPYGQTVARPKKTHGEGLSNDRFYRNDTPQPTAEENQSVACKFTDATREAGILTEGYGLGVAISDINQDGWPDVYVANDFITNDLLWINNQDGTFTDKAPDYFKHQTHNGMGTDVADFNNDGLVDIVVLDMLPEDNFRQKMMFGRPNDERFKLNLHYGYTPQYVRNTLQLNNGLTPAGEPSFSEIGQLAGVYKTDWSWSALFADFDNDGYRDLLITNGYAKDVTDMDYASYRSSVSQFGTSETKREQAMELAALLKEAKVHNYVFKNNRDLTFADVSADWGMTTPSFSNGTAFADFDQDGDLDLVTNNINDEAFVYENTLEKNSQNNYLRLQLIGPSANPAGLQTSVRLKYDGQQQFHYHSVYRGYKSTVEGTIHFGVGAHPTIDSLEIIWPDSSYQLLTNVATNQTLRVRYQDATTAPPTNPPSSPPLLADISASLQLNYQHQEEDFIDFKYEPLLPRRYSQDGPGLAVGDINGDGTDDFYVGGAKRQPGRFFIQDADGTFTAQQLPDDSVYEDMGAVLFDADQDGDQDLYVVSGGNEFAAGNAAYYDRFYRNDGQGNFTVDSAAIPAIASSGSCVRAADYDHDGDLDLFVGGRLLPKQYPLPVSSFILRNEGGHFVDATQEIAPELVDIGLVTDALWTDFNQDQQLDLIVVGEWMPITFFRNEGGKLTEATADTRLPITTGWWNTLVAEDFDQDGDLDYLAGNLGLNSKYKASATEPVCLYTKDYDQDGRIDPLLSYYVMGTEYPAAYRDALSDQMNSMRRRFSDYETYARTALKDVFTAEEMEGAYVLQAERLTTSYLENQGDGTFTIRDMPIITQTAPVYRMIADDLNDDGFTDVMMVGNSYATEVHQGWYDAFVGQVLLGDGSGNFRSLSLEESGFYVDTDAKDMIKLRRNGEPLWVVANNNDSLSVFAKTPTPSYQPMATK